MNNTSAEIDWDDCDNGCAVTWRVSLHNNPDIGEDTVIRHYVTVTFLPDGVWRELTAEHVSLSHTTARAIGRMLREFACDVVGSEHPLPTAEQTVAFSISSQCLVTGVKDGAPTDPGDVHKLNPQVLDTLGHLVEITLMLILTAPEDSSPASLLERVINGVNIMRMVEGLASMENIASDIAGADNDNAEPPASVLH